MTHEPKFLSENLSIVPAGGKGVKYSFIFARPQAALVEELVRELRIRISAPIWPLDPSHAEAPPETEPDSEARPVIS